MVYELLALAASDNPEMQLREGDQLLSEMTWKASHEFERGNFPAAELGNIEILKAFPKYSFARFMITECAAMPRSDRSHIPAV